MPARAMIVWLWPAMSAGNLTTRARLAPRRFASIDKSLPPGVSGVFSQAVSAASHHSAAESVTALIAGVLVALSSVAGGVSVLQIALDVAYEVPADRRFMARRLRSLHLMLATVPLGLTASALSVFGASVGKAIESHTPFAGTAFAVIWNVVRWVIVVAALALLLSIYYSYGPNRKAARWRWSTPGGAVGAVILVLASLGFSFYVKDFGSYGKIYGAFAGVVILIIWLYLGGLAVLVGAEINAESERQAGARASPSTP